MSAYVKSTMKYEKKFQGKIAKYMESIQCKDMTVILNVKFTFSV